MNCSVTDSDIYCLKPYLHFPSLFWTYQLPYMFFLFCTEKCNLKTCTFVSLFDVVAFMLSTHPVFQVYLLPAACLILFKALCLPACFLGPFLCKSQDSSFISFALILLFLFIKKAIRGFVTSVPSICRVNGFT